MAKHPREISPEQLAAFEGAMSRIKEVTGAHTQVQLAEVLEVRQSSISDAKRRASIPDGWLVKLLRTHQVMPDWILTGEGPKFAAEAAPAAVAQVQERLHLVIQDVARMVSRVDEALDFIRLTEADVAQRKAFHAGVLSCDVEKARGIFNELKGMADAVSAQPSNH